MHRSEVSVFTQLLDPWIWSFAKNSEDGILVLHQNLQRHILGDVSVSWSDNIAQTIEKKCLLFMDALSGFLVLDSCENIGVLHLSCK